jgi:hypothetical protein
VCDRRAGLEDQPEALPSEPPREPKEDVERGTVDEEESVEIEDEARVVGVDQRLEALLDLMCVRKVELARDVHDDEHRIVGRPLFEVVRRHSGSSSREGEHSPAARSVEALFGDRDDQETPEMDASGVRFAHPVERELARLFDEHGVRWLYEPHTFVLQSDPDGTVREAFTPDFFLPELGLYVECTVMRQCLTGRKRRKVRKVAAQKGVTVAVLYGRDIERLAERWSLDTLAEAVHPGAA